MSPWRMRAAPALTPLFRAWWRVRRGLTLGVRAVICDESGAVMLVRHSYAPGWHFPGGGVEHDETAFDAVRREAAEEAGIEALAPPALVGAYSNHAAFRNDHILLYRFDRWRACAPAIGNEIAERGFFPREALPAGATPGTRRRLAEMFAGAPTDPFW